MYSVRPGTYAGDRLADDVPQAEKKSRLLAVEAGAGGDSRGHQRQAPRPDGGGPGRGRDEERGRWRGRTRTNKLVHFADDRAWWGRLAEARIDWTGPWSLLGTAVGGESPLVIPRARVSLPVLGAARSLILRVALTPAEVVVPESSVCVVVDVLRATSTLATILAAGCTDVVLEPTVERARAWAERGRLLGGESGGVRPEGFDFGNSPVEYAARDLGGAAIAFATTNGTKALMLAARAPVVLAGCLLNGPAVVRLARREAAQRGLDVQVVCAGREEGTAVALDDAFCGGYLVSLLVETGEVGSREGLRLADSAVLALRLYEAYRSGREGVEEAALAAFADATSSRVLGRHGLGADVRYCARVDTLDVVPRARLDGEVIRVERT